MNFKKFFKEKILGLMECPIPSEYKRHSDEHIFICSGNCTKCYHFKSYQFDSYRKEIKEYITEQHKTITGLNQKLKEAKEQKLITPEQKELQELRQFKNDLTLICTKCPTKTILEEIAYRKYFCTSNPKTCHYER